MGRSTRRLLYQIIILSALSIKNNVNSQALQDNVPAFLQTITDAGMESTGSKLMNSVLSIAAANGVLPKVVTEARSIWPLRQSIIPTIQDIQPNPDNYFQIQNQISPGQLPTLIANQPIPVSPNFCFGPSKHLLPNTVHAQVVLPHILQSNIPNVSPKLKPSFGNSPTYLSETVSLEPAKSNDALNVIALEVDNEEINNLFPSQNSNSVNENFLMPYQLEINVPILTKLVPTQDFGYASQLPQTPFGQPPSPFDNPFNSLPSTPGDPTQPIILQQFTVGGDKSIMRIMLEAILIDSCTGRSNTCVDNSGVTPVPYPIPFPTYNPTMLDSRPKKSKRKRQNKKRTKVTEDD